MSTGENYNESERHMSLSSQIPEDYQTADGIMPMARYDEEARDEAEVNEQHNDIDSNEGAESISNESSLNDVKEFQPQQDNNEGDGELKRSPSVIERIQSRISFFSSSSRSERFELTKKFLIIYLLMFVCILGIFSIYWGSSYNRQSRLHNLKMLVVIEDDETVDGVEPLMGNIMKQILNTDQVKFYGNWEIQNTTEFNEVAKQHNNTIHEEIERQIHHQLYWDSIYVTKNASANFKDYIENPNSQVNVSNLIYTIYETGRDFLNMNSYVKSSVQVVEQAWAKQQSQLYQLFDNSSDFRYDQLSRLLTPINFNAQDLRPWTDTVLVAPSQVGLIYIIILTFFQVNMFGDVHQEVSKFNLKHRHYVLYRLLSSYFSYFIISLIYSLVTLAFQVDFTVAFGRSGFLVYWMFSYITMIACGIMNELMFMVLLIVFPPLVGFWLLFWVLINISPTFAPIALLPNFFRFGYAMPIHNSYELTKVIFFDTYKGQMGRNIGILFAWIVIASGCFAAIIGPFSKIMGKRMKAKAQAQATAKQQQEKKQQEHPEA